MLPICYLHFDTEFANFSNFALLSIGLVSEDKEFEFYKEVNDFDLNTCSEFVKNIVIPLLDLPKYGLPYKELSQSLISWINQLPFKEVVFIADYSGDVIILERIISLPGDIKLEKKFKIKLIDKALSQVVRERGLYDYRNIHKAFKALSDGIDAALKKEPQRQHHALYDAYANCEGWNMALNLLKDLKN